MAAVNCSTCIRWRRCAKGFVNMGYCRAPETAAAPFWRSGADQHVLTHQTHGGPSCAAFKAKRA